ncbi:hypothetical protein TeGR_g1052 [Tetraparma gracilis]|uniref:Uncharacterized protein n=1 Tax=Tetraparma gracilis TaxID=2962635 RepID=A0ABQ6N7C1_9STRA|nr:hypothetical protein TeGR_g1052 [Tetraparma gracilis]
MLSAGSSGASERRNSLVGSVLHRLSVDLGVFDGPDDNNPLGALLPHQVLDEEQAIAATQSTVVGGLETVDNPVSILYHFFRSNVEGLVSATPALAFILGSKLLVDWLAAKGGPWGDTMGARCAICVAGVPAQIAFAALLSYAAFDWKPGMWTPAMMTLSWWLSMIAHYPLDEEKKPFLQHVRGSLVIALVGHLVVVGFIYAIVIPTRLLAENDKPILTLLTTGAAFPFLAFLFRKAFVRLMWNHASSLTSSTPVQRMELYANGVKIGSLTILITPTVTLYFNTNIRYAIGSAMMQIVTEIAAKIVTVYAMKMQIKVYAEAMKDKPKGALSKVKVAVLKASQEAGVNQDVQQGAMDELRRENSQLKLENAAQKKEIATLRRRLKRREGGGDGNVSEEHDHRPGLEADEEVNGADDEEGGGEDEQASEASVIAKQKHAFAMIAVRWHAEIVAEKGCILVAALIAYLYFADLVETDSTGLVLVGCVFYAAEALCDIIFVWVIDGHLDVPMLSAVAYEPLLSKDSVLGAVMLALTFVSMSGCIAMAASIEL